MEEIAKLFAIMLMGYAVVKVGLVKSVQLILIWTHCKNMLCEEDKLEWKKVLLNVNIISIIVGVVLFIGRIHPVYRMS